MTADRTDVELDAAREIVGRLLEKGTGVLRLEPAWVARDWLPPGRRLGLEEGEYAVGERGFICERWLGSTTKADNRVGPEDEGLSYLQAPSRSKITLDTAVKAMPEAILGGAYAAEYPSLGRLAKIFDFGERIPYHLHQREMHARLVGRHSKDEAYYFPAGIEMGKHPETFFGVNPWIAETKQYDVLLPYLEDWNSDLILKHARGYVIAADEGFHIPSGVLHAPGTALTIELQEDSDVLAMLQALNAGRIISKDLLFKDVRPEDRARYGERFILELIDWELSGDPYFYENRHLTPQPIGNPQAGSQEFWIFANSTKFSGKKLVVKPGQTFSCRENGVYSLLVWQGSGSYAEHDVAAGDPHRDELLLVHDRAIEPHEVRNDGSDDLVIIKFFGPDINPEVPKITPWHRSD